MFAQDLEETPLQRAVALPLVHGKKDRLWYGLSIDHLAADPV